MPAFLLTLVLAARRAVYLTRNRFFPAPYVVGPTCRSFKRAVLRTHNQRRERGNVQRYLGKRRGRFHATA
jgi:hypothetical protein